jgi:hypothetical protein
MRFRLVNDGTPFADAIEALLPQLEADATTLDDVARVLGVRGDPFKIGAARAGEMLGRLKFNGQLRGYSPLSRVLELEGLMAGIEAKRQLWKALKAAHRPELADFDFTTLATQAGEQRDHLKAHHRLAAQMTLSASAP